MASFPDALTAALERVDAANWQTRLDALHARHRTWTATAEAIGADRRTVERWRFGYQPKPRADGSVPARRRVDPATFLPRLREAWTADRRAQVAAVDWRRLHMVGWLQVHPYDPRRQTINLGSVLSGESIRGLVQAYLAADDGLIQTAVDTALTVDYVGTPATLHDVEALDFG